MSRSKPPARVPTLTEVLDQSNLPAEAAEPASAADTGPEAPAPVAAAQTLAMQAEIAGRINHELQAHVDRVLDARIRAALAPVLEQTVTEVIELTRRELASTLRDGLARALAQESSRHRGGS